MYVGFDLSKEINVEIVEIYNGSLRQAKPPSKLFYSEGGFYLCR
jgi:hypothetical protein